MAEKKLVSVRHFPEELQLEIFHRLPYKYVARSKCACKAWNTMLSDPQFVRETNLRRYGSTQLIMFEADYDNDQLSTLVKAPYKDLMNVTENEAKLPLISLGSPPLCFHNDMFYLKEFEVLGSFNGLVAMLYGTGEYVLWNPVTQQHHSVCHNAGPSTLLYECVNFFGMCYDASTEEYAVVVARNYKNPHGIGYLAESVSIVSFRNVVRKDQDYSALGCKLVDFSSNVGLVVCGVPHWAVSYCEIGSKRVKKGVLYFDLKEKKFKKVVQPLCVQEVSHKIVIGLAALDGQRQLGMVVHDVLGKGLEVWVMKQYRKPRTWVQLFTIPSMSPLTLLQLNPMDLLGFMPTGELLVDVNQGRGSNLDTETAGLWVYDQKSGRVRRTHSWRERMHMTITTYEPSFVSPAPMTRCSARIKENLRRKRARPSYDWRV